VPDEVCFLPCDEYADLKRAMPQYEATPGRAKPTRKATAASGAI
jgi:hypothetical protein